MKEQFWTFVDVAEYLNVKIDWLKANYRKLGIPFRKFGRSIRFLPSEVKHWAESYSDVA